MKTIEEIKDLKKYLVNDFYGKRVNQQQEDDKYYTDTFSVPLVKNPDYIVRTGRGRRMVDKPIEHIISLSPQFFRDNTRKGQADADANVAVEGNRWIKKLSSENPNPFWEHARNLMLRGEAWIYVVHNDSLPAGWQKSQPEAMPVRFIIQDPLIVFADPSEDEVNGVPPAVIISYERVVSTLTSQYPHWETNKGATQKSQFFMYMDKDIRYIEADDQPISDGIEPTIYKKKGDEHGFVPFVHCYSGFGRNTAENNPATLAFGRLTAHRKLLENESTIESDIAWTIHKFAYKTIDIIIRSGLEVSQKEVDAYNARAQSLNVIHLGVGDEIDRDTGLPPPPEVFAHRAGIKMELDMEDPQVPSGTSGRHEDIIYSSWRKRFEPVISGSGQSWATGIGIGLKICEIIPDWIPPALKKEDIGGRYDCRVELRASDPIEEDRKRLLGRSLYEAKQIDLKTNLVEYQGYTEPKADTIISRIMVDGATINNPIIAQILGVRFAKEQGMQEYLDALKQQGATQQEMQNLLPQSGLGQPAGPGSQGGPPRTLNIQTPQGQEMIDMSLMQRGERRSPVGVA